MLVPSMNHNELCIQIIREYLKLRMTTIKRLISEYDRERKKLHIKKEDSYFKEYPIKTKGKNTWIIFLHKAPSQPKYTNTDCINLLGVVYFYDKIGLRVFSVSDSLLLNGYNGHFFRRYKERLNLDLTEPLDIVKSFIKNSGYSQVEITEKNKKKYAFGISKEGILLGEYLEQPAAGFEWKTFISRNLLYNKQDLIETNMIKELQAEIENLLKSNTGHSSILAGKRDVYLSLTG